MATQLFETIGSEAVDPSCDRVPTQWGIARMRKLYAAGAHKALGISSIHGDSAVGYGHPKCLLPAFRWLLFLWLARPLEDISTSRLEFWLCGSVALGMVGHDNE